MSAKAHVLFESGALDTGVAKTCKLRSPPATSWRLRRHWLRLLPRLKGLAARSDRRLALRGFKWGDHDSQDTIGLGHASLSSLALPGLNEGQGLVTDTADAQSRIPPD